MCFKPLEILVAWDDESKCWIARGEGIVFLPAKAKSREAMRGKLDAILQEIKARYGDVPVDENWDDAPGAVAASAERSGAGEERRRRIQQEIAALETSDFAAIRDWFLAYDAERWDRRLEADVASGRLDSIVETAISEYRAGKARSL